MAPAPQFGCASTSGTLIDEVPTYAYRCDALHEFEVVQPIVAAPLSSCPSCGLPVRRVVFPVGIVFKGQGFYKTDSRSSGGPSTSPPKPDAAPAAAPAAEGPAKPAANVSPATTSPAPKGATAGGSGTGEKNG